MERLRFWLKGRITKLGAVSIALCMSMLMACHPYYGYMQYEVHYPTGFIYGFLAYQYPQNVYPIENSELSFEERLNWEEDIQYITLLEEGEEVWTWEKPFPNSRIRAQVVEEELWFCAENWDAGLGFFVLDGLLFSGTLYQLDMKSGEVLCERETEEHEFFLSKIGERFYFYHRGGRREYAQIYYRELSDWEEKHELYQFDYKEAPKETGGGYVLKFILGEEEITIEYWNTEVDRVVGEYRGEPVYERTEELLWSQQVLLEKE